MKQKIAVIRGDGIGPEIITEALKVLEQIARKYGHLFTYDEVIAGGCAIDRYGKSLTPEMLEKCLTSDSVLLGAVGGPQWDGTPKDIRPEAALLGIRSALGLYSNLRPAKLFPQLAEASPLKNSIVEQGIDLMMVRELIGGAYFGEKRTVTMDTGEKKATDEMVYSEHEVERVARVAFDTARKRRNQVTSIDKANVLETSRLWRTVLHRVAEEYTDVSYTDMLVDNAAMQLVKNPAQFDVVVTENMFGDILSDEASMITGSIGMIPSASLGDTVTASGSKLGMYEPIHGSAPDIAGKNLANPIGTILSAAMMLGYSFGMTAESDEIEKAVNAVLDEGYRTGDCMSEGMRQLSCSEMGDRITAKIQ